MAPRGEGQDEPHRFQTTMPSRQFTDAENTGAPLVPMIADHAVATDGGQPTAEYLEEVVWSHRRPE